MIAPKKKRNGTKSSNNESRGWPGDNSLSIYFKEIKEYHKLTSEEEADCARRYREGDENALEKLIISNLCFVVFIAKRYQCPGVSLPDLINEGNIGLIRAARKFDEKLGVRFITYAIWWIKQAIFQCLSEQGHIVRVPSNWSSAICKIQKERDRLSQELGRDPTNREISQEIQVSIKKVNKMMPHCLPHYSLEAGSDTQDDMILGDSLPDEESPGPMEEVLNRNLKRFISLMLKDIRKREAKILEYYYGLGNSKPMTLEEIGKIFGVTRERVRQIKEEALRKLCKLHGNAIMKAL